MPAFRRRTKAEKRNRARKKLRRQEKRRASIETWISNLLVFAKAISEITNQRGTHDNP